MRIYRKFTSIVSLSHALGAISKGDVQVLTLDRMGSHGDMFGK